MSDWLVSSKNYDAVPVWPGAGATVAQNALCKPSGTLDYGSERVFIAETVTGATGAAEPTWNANNNDTTVDGGVTWRCITGQASHGWAAAAPNTGVLGFSFGPYNGDNVYVADDSHTLVSSGNGLEMKVYGRWDYPSIYTSVKRTGSVPPVAADVSQGAIFETTGNVPLMISSMAISTCTMRGITFRSAYQIEASTYISHHEYVGCRFEITSASAQTRAIESGGLDSGAVYEDSVFKYAAAEQTMFLKQQGNVEVKGGSIDPTGVSPNIAFHIDGANLRIENFDFSALQPGQACLQSGAQGNGYMINPIIPDGVEEVRFGNIDEGATQTGPDGWVVVRRSNGTVARYHNFGVEDTDTSVARVGGNATSQSVKLRHPETNSYTATTDVPYESIQLGYMAQGGSATLTMHYVTDAPALPDNSQIYVQASYNGGFKSTAPANHLAPSTPTVADTATQWSGPSRTSGHPYVAGDVFENPSVPGQLIVVTADGAAAASCACWLCRSR
jgi:hypothetical protein